MKAHRPCPACGADNHVRRKVCVSCGHAFPVKDGVVEVNDDGDIEVVKTQKVARLPDGYDLPDDARVEIIYTPAGECPIRLNLAEADDDAILDWAMSVRQTCLNDGIYLTNNALGYWASKFVPGININTVKVLRGLINTLPDVTYREVPV